MAKLPLCPIGTIIEFTHCELKAVIIITSHGRGENKYRYIKCTNPVFLGDHEFRGYLKEGIISKITFPSKLYRLLHDK